MENQYKLRLDSIEAVLDKWLPVKPDSSWLERIFGSRGEVSPDLAVTLTRPAWDLVNRGGKRWRPLLMVLTAEAVAGEPGYETALPLTPLVEFAHNASLMHDDIEDNSEERRGKPAVHLLYGTDTAINSGAFMYFLSSACLFASQNELKSRENFAIFQNRIWAAWADHLASLHLGQAMDIAWHRDFRSLPGLEEYDRMCRLKTGCLARLAGVLGVYSGGSCINVNAGALDTVADIFGNGAELLGVGFQILDDVKNLSTGIPGKKRGDDIVEGKKSLPVLLYLHRYPEKRDFTARCFSAARAAGTDAPEVEAMIDSLSGAGVLEEAREIALFYLEKSRKIFSGDTPVPEGFILKKEGLTLLSGLIDQLT